LLSQHGQIRAVAEAALLVAPIPAVGAVSVALLAVVLVPRLHSMVAASRQRRLFVVHILLAEVSAE
jgi:hypothetical protein